MTREISVLVAGPDDEVRQQLAEILLDHAYTTCLWLVLDTEALRTQRRYVAKIPFLKAANAKFRKEAEICARLAHHPGVLKLVNQVEDEGRLVLIQEYVEGKTLGDL